MKRGLVYMITGMLLLGDEPPENYVPCDDAKDESVTEAWEAEIQAQRAQSGGWERFRVPVRRTWLLKRFGRYGRRAYPLGFRPADFFGEVASKLISSSHFILSSATLPSSAIVIQFSLLM